MELENGDTLNTIVMSLRSHNPSKAGLYDGPDAGMSRSLFYVEVVSAGLDTVTPSLKNEDSTFFFCGGGGSFFLNGINIYQGSLEK